MRWNGAYYFAFDGKWVETKETTISEFLNEGKPNVEQVLASEERNKSKRAGLWECENHSQRYE